MSVPNIIFNANFLTSTDLKKGYTIKDGKKVATKEKNLKISNKLYGYLSREEAVENNKEIFLSDFDTDNEFLKKGYLNRDKAKEYHNQIFKEEGRKIEYFSDDGIVYNTDIKKIKNDISEMDKIQSKKNSALYFSHISFSEEFSNKHIKNKFSEKELFEKMKPGIEKFLQQQNFKKSNIKYVASFHSNTDNLHLHFDFVEKEPTKRKNLLDKKYFVELKKELLFSIDPKSKKEYLNIFKSLEKEKDNLRSEIKQLDFKKQKEITENYKKIKKLIENNPKEIKRYLGDIKNKELKKDIVNISDKMFDNLIDTKKLQNSTKDITEYNRNVLGERNIKTSLEQKNIEELKKQFSNQIFKEIKQDIQNEKVQDKISKFSELKESSIKSYKKQLKTKKEQYLDSKTKFKVQKTLNEAERKIAREKQSQKTYDDLLEEEYYK